MNVNDKVINYVSIGGKMHTTKHNFESFQQEMKIYQDFDVTEYFNKLEKLRKEYISVLKMHSTDFLITDKMRNNAQTMLNKALNMEG